MKRKGVGNGDSPSKRRNTAIDGPEALRSAFRPDLFGKDTLQSFRKSYAGSGPYPHAVVPSLIQESLLRSVRSEIIAHIHFTQKETDIYRIHQSGDLANLSNLDAESLKHLPSLVHLRDALYSSDFREWVSTVTGAGKVSGKKTDMAVNVYTPGSYLLCHDDVIGSRRVSYILYLTDPDHPWQPEWGGGLRLYPTETKQNKAGENIQVPLAEHSLNIPPSFGQLSFFAVRPGESYHDVEEVYHGSDPEADGGRIRMAISGWYHIPQEGEDGFEEGIEQKQVHRSTLAQLKSADNEFDEPQLIYRHFDEPRKVMDSHADHEEVDPGDKDDTDDDLLTEQDLTFLLHYMTPHYLTPDMIEDFSSSFADLSMLQLEQFFNPTFANELKEYISAVENEESEPKSSKSSHPSHWGVARPPHKHRYAYLQGAEALHRDKTPISRVLTDLLHSHAFKKWLALVTGLKTKSLIRQNAIARRFRRGKDYALANPFQGEQPQIEFTISITPTEGWERADEDGEEDQKAKKAKKALNGQNGHTDRSKGKGKQKAVEPEKVQVSTSTEIEYGGEEVYMAGDDDDNVSVHSKSLPNVGKKTDPAVYKSSMGETDDDDGILFTNPASWNRFSIVLRDKGTLRFVKYVSQAADGDRWDIKGEVEVGEDAWDDGENGEGLNVDFDDEDEDEEEDDEGIDDDDDEDEEDDG
ncbi:Oxoglutarate and iron-dependent oxygenase degradation C-term-domain-containing protein [Exophiala viscosa]|uniref:Oxoglutarate and iron-dependent oxygenase degradation C-term-domain-containing protein n=1 Tax=Exophiala viscosa TaxID=2486360 RepID=UPI0021A06B56|nr:Oxoglutarate and iron-dependent oxygenase degradation C-term-domain-containing protein [Exophiala viscosa]